jgi:integrase
MPQHIQAFYMEKLKGGLKSSTVALIHAVLHKALENAVKWNLVSRNVASLVSVPHSDPHEVRALTSDEARRLIEAAQGHWLEPLLILALTTGMRRGELLGLRWSDIDVSRGMLHVRRTANRYPGYGFVENDPKTKRSRRNIMLSDIALQALRDHQLLQTKVKTEAHEQWQERDLVFSDHSGGFLTPETVWRHFQSLLEKAALPHMRFHDLRHSAATILLTMGVHPKVVQELLGHSTIAITMDTYSHLLPSMQRDAAGKMNEVFRFGEDSEKR